MIHVLTLPAAPTHFKVGLRSQERMNPTGTMFSNCGCSYRLPWARFALWRLGEFDSMATGSASRRPHLADPGPVSSKNNGPRDRRPKHPIAWLHRVREKSFRALTCSLNPSHSMQPPPDRANGWSDTKYSHSLDPVLYKEGQRGSEDPPHYTSLVMVVPSVVKPLLIAVARLFIPAQHARAINATIRAYSTRSWPSSRESRS